MKTLLVILALLISGSTYAWGTPTKNIGCYGMGKAVDMSALSAFVNGSSGSSNGTGQVKKTGGILNIQ